MMFLYETIRLGLANLALHKLRSLLTALGIIFGVFSVVFMVAIGEGNRRKALADIEKLGAQNIIVTSVKPPESRANSSQGGTRQVLTYGLTRRDVQRISETVAPVQRMVALKQVGTRASQRALTSNAATFGVVPELLEVTNLHVERGRYIAESDLSRAENVAVIGAEIAARLFPLQDPLVGTVRLGEQVFRVVGVLAPVGLAGGTGTALVGRNLNYDVHIPLSTAELRFGDMQVVARAGSFEANEVELTLLYIQVPSQGDVIPVAEQVRRVLDVEHDEAKDVDVTVPLELLEQAERTQRMFNYLMVAIACISLLVGGIGIMNIMLASVTERTREIGIRRALGATRRHIIAQFLVETTVLSVVGGLIGVGLGVLGTLTLTALQPLFPNLARPFLTQWSIGLSFAVATGVGIIFGVYPAVQAARQDPIVALRHD
jgi:putative ABC transport system permease protein